MKIHLRSASIVVAALAASAGSRQARADDFHVFAPVAAWHQSSAHPANYINEELDAYYIGSGNITIAVGFEVYCDPQPAIMLPTQLSKHFGSVTDPILSLPRRAEYPIPGYSTLPRDSTCNVIYNGAYTLGGGGISVHFDGFGIGFTSNDVVVPAVKQSTTFPVHKPGQDHVCQQDTNLRETGGNATPNLIDGCLPDSPILIDLGQDGFDLGPAGVGVYFDNDDNGRPEHLQWVRPGGNEAFLVMDRNGNGTIDNGSELFGIGTPMILEGGQAPNGFVGLAQYDNRDLGGNDDGWITAADTVWSDLRLWLDRNADGICTPDELLTLERAGVRALPTVPRASRRRDAAGNYLRFQADAVSDLNVRKMQMIDVYFLRL